MKKLTSILSVILLMSSTAAFAGSKWNTVRANSKSYVKHKKGMNRDFKNHKRKLTSDTNKLIADAKKQMAVHREYKVCVRTAGSYKQINTCNKRWSRRINSIR